MQIEIKDPWKMPELRDCGAIIAWMRERLGRHPLGKRTLFPLALLEDSSRAIIEADEGEEFYAVVDFYQQKGGRLVAKPSVTMLPDRASVQRLIDETNAAYRKNMPNQSLEPTPISVTPAANAPVAPDTGVAHL